MAIDKSKQNSNMPQTLNDFYKIMVLKLSALYPVEEARSMADRVFEHFLLMTPSQRVISGSATLDEEKKTRMENVVSRLLKQEPLQYVLGKAYFLDMEFDVDISVLIPRPETEELVSLVINSYSPKSDESLSKIIDIGTGSGCIAIGLKHNFPDSEVFAVDLSEKALHVASANAAKNMAEVNFIKADILDIRQWDLLPEFNLIVSNPPYITHAEKMYMQPNVLEHEPDMALFVPDEDPLIFYRVIMAFAKNKLIRGGNLWFEINEMFGNEMKEMALNQGFTDVNIIFDFRGKSRFLHCRKSDHQHTS
ncbi:MAG: peptide chain release factor N(5)-glutamine methyltransferase [Bacteroidales bacterium]